MPSRAQIAAELRSHIAERLAHGHSLDDVLGKLGDPAKLADSYLSAEPLMSAPVRIARRCEADRRPVRVPRDLPLAWLLTRLVPPGDGGPWGGFRPIVFLCATVIGGSMFVRHLHDGCRVSERATIGKQVRGLPRGQRERRPHQPGGQAVVRQLPMFLADVLDRRDVCAVHREEPARVRDAVENPRRAVATKWKSFKVCFSALGY